jgi:tRNA 2-thiouridine synthesizing protein A
VKTAERVKSLSPGTILEVIATDAGLDADLRNWCRVRRHEYLGCRAEGKEFHAFLRVK